MDQRSFRNLLRRTVAIPVILLVLLAGTLVMEILSLTSAQRWVDRTDRVVSSARDLFRSMVDMETGLRGYYATHDTSFLEPYYAARPEVPIQLARLEQLISDSPDQVQRLHQLGELDQRWMQYADALLANPEVRSLSTDEYANGKALMDQVRGKQRELVDTEQHTRQARFDHATRLSRVVIGTATGLLLLTALALLTLTRRELYQLSSTYEQHLKAEADKTQQLRESREWFQTTLKSLGDAVIAADARGRVTFINPVAERLTGWSAQQARQRPILEVLQPADERSRGEIVEPIEVANRQQPSLVPPQRSDSIVLTNRSGRQYPIEFTGAPITDSQGTAVGAVLVFRDVTHRRQTEQTLRTNERLTVAGRLSATIAHEIRNPLDTVSNLVYLLQHEEHGNSSVKQYLDMASDEVARIAQITTQLLTFHREASQPVQVNLTEVLESVLVLYAPQIRKSHVQVIKRFDHAGTVRGYPGELRQVFSNLVGNALDAMGDGGRLMLHVRESSQVGNGSRKGVRVTVLDNGPGIPPGVRKNLFAPFFTTKGEKGTGLGLWVSRGIVDKHEGTIHLSSSLRDGRCGTAFSVFLPREQNLGLLDLPNYEPE